MTATLIPSMRAAPTLPEEPTMRLSALPMLLLAACITETSYTNKLTEISCKRFEECDPVSFGAFYGSKDDCTVQTSDVLEPVNACREAACTFDKKAAATCLKEYGDLSCTALASGTAPSSCLDAYANCDQLTLAVCIAGTGLSFDTGF